MKEQDFIAVRPKRVSSLLLMPGKLRAAAAAAASASGLATLAFVLAVLSPMPGSSAMAAMAAGLEAASIV